MNLESFSMLKVAKYFVSFSVFLFLAFSVSFKGSYGYSGAFLILSYLFLFSKEVRREIVLSRAEKGLITVLLLFLLSVLLEITFYSIPVSEIDSESKILLFIPLVFLLNAVRMDPKIIIYGIATGCIGLLSLAVYERYYLGLERTGSFINAIQLGNIAMVFGLLSCVMACYSYKRFRYYVPICVLLLVAALCGVFASLSTLTRGGLVFLPLIVILISIYFIKEIKAYKKQFTFGGVLIIVSLFFLLNDSEIKSRLMLGVAEVENYLSGHEVNTSIGLRLELWKAAVLIGKENPILGVGADQYLALKASLIDQNILDSSILSYGHSHNAYLYAFARRGVAGVFFLLLMLTFPLVIAHSGLKKKNADNRAIPVGILLFGLFFIFANLTQVLFAHNSGMIMYTGLLILLIHFNRMNNGTSTENLRVAKVLEKSGG